METNSILQLLKTHKVVIPPIQRDYAQGRTTGKTPKVRERFLNAVYEVLANDNLPIMELDFIYGYTENDVVNETEKISVFKPLDGQQRLTTLFLLHWYFANIEKARNNEFNLEEIKKLLLKFSYATRHSSSSFCQNLIEFQPVFNGKTIDEQIVNQPWFFSNWKNNPTIASMLVVLKDISILFKDMNNVWSKLSGDTSRIVFHLLPMNDLGLPDDLYIKMNARGKELTDFEHFKSQFTEILSPDQAKEFVEKIDKEWSDLFWNIFKNKESSDIAKEVDNGFSAFFWYITELIIARKKIVVNETYWLDIIKRVYQESSDNVKFLFDAINLFENLEKKEPNYFDDLFYINVEDFSLSKTRLFFNSPQTNLFRKCAEAYGFGERKNQFSVGEQLLLYAFIFMKLETDIVNPLKFRKLRNIFASSEFQLRNEFLSTFLYEDVEYLILHDEFSPDSKLSKRQFEEERSKKQFVENHPELLEYVYKLEDHTLLRGNIALFDFNENLSIYAEQFLKIFVPGCNYFEISKALLTIGDYTQNIGKFKRFGNNNNSTWRELFTQSENRDGFQNTKDVIKQYLTIFIDDKNKTPKNLIQDYLSRYNSDYQIEKGLIFYYIKYPSFSKWNENQTDGYYWWYDLALKPYECWMLFKTQFNGRHWSPFLLELSSINENCNLENYGNELKFVFENYIIFISNKDNGFEFKGIDEESINFIDSLRDLSVLNSDSIYEIKQNEQGLDLVDRVKEMDKLLNELVTLNKKTVN
ncbi:hypothetical protein FB1_21730 [Flavobacterium branchiophilum NBRC 15030 = ATCC 35035]|nr:hypothetical protein FB1_21730 [Flavobacterium branchiophilum NBRC 15030 = ATCC 35035]